MRKIQKSTEPRELTEWRTTNKSDINFGYSLIDANLRRTILEALVAEQRSLCAYSGRRITATTCHVEHEKAQEHCSPDETVAYANMRACVPAPNTAELPYGAQPKKSWPPPSESHLFVTPGRDDCESRFVFNLKGEVRPADRSDTAATTTIEKLGLNHKQLIDLRKEAIEATIGTTRRGPASLDAKQVRHRLAVLRSAETAGGELEPFCFVLVQALTLHLKRLTAIKARRPSRR